MAENLQAVVFEFEPRGELAHLDFTDAIRHVGRQMATYGRLGPPPYDPEERIILPNEDDAAFVITITQGYKMHVIPLDSRDGNILQEMLKAGIDLRLTCTAVVESGKKDATPVVWYIVPRESEV